jgi:hypothetical protein
MTVVTGRIMMAFASLVAALWIGGCGSSLSDGSIRARTARACRSIILNSASHSYTTPGSEIDHGAGSCTRRDLSAVLALVSRFRRTALPSSKVKLSVLRNRSPSVLVLS